MRIIAGYIYELRRFFLPSVSVHFSQGGIGKADRESQRALQVKQPFFTLNDNPAQYRRIFVPYSRIICTLLCAAG